MKHIATLIGAAAVVISAAALAVEPAKPLPINETNEQKCARWADHDNLQGDSRAEFFKDCLIDLKVADPKDEGGGDE